MSTTPHKADFRTALTGYHTALENYQAAVVLIENEALKSQWAGREALAKLNAAALEAGVRFTQVSRATTDARVISFEVECGACTPDQATVKAALASLDAKLAQLKAAKVALDEARKALDECLDTAVAAAEGARASLATLVVEKK
jgi:hypothetical protein